MSERRNQTKHRRCGPPLPPQTLQKLALVRYMFNNGVHESEQPTPLSATAVLLFHDSIELFLGLACQHLNIVLNDGTQFMQYFAAIEKHFGQGKGLTHAESMRRHNKLRVAFKHHAVLPADSEIVAFRATATAFFVENTPRVFGVEFESVSLIDLVQFEEAREHLTKAVRLKRQRKTGDALTEVSFGFQRLLDEWQESNGFDSPFRWALPHLRNPTGRRYTPGRPGIEGAVEDLVEDLRRTLGPIRDAVELLCFGVDYRKYLKFLALTPCVRYDYQTAFPGAHPGPTKCSTEDFEFCINFVVETALTLQGIVFGTARTSAGHGSVGDGSRTRKNSRKEDEHPS